MAWQNQKQHDNVKVGYVFTYCNGKKYTVVGIPGTHDGTNVATLINEDGEYWYGCRLEVSLWKKEEEIKVPYRPKLSEKYKNRETDEIWEVTGLSVYGSAKPFSCILTNCETRNDRCCDCLHSWYWDKIEDEV